MLHESIGAADRRQFTSVRDPRDWKNPFLLINTNGTITVITSAGDQIVAPEDLKALLMKLAPSEWSFGKVVSIRPAAARSESKEQFEEEDRQIKLSWGLMRQTMRELQIEMNVWPSADSTHATVTRDESQARAQTEIVDRSEHEPMMSEAIAEASKASAEGGIPVGSVLVRGGVVIARGHNRHVQTGDPTAHADLDCLRNAGRQKTFRDTILYTTLMPCAMCAGAVIQFKIPLVVAGEDKTFSSARRMMESNGVKVIDLNLDSCHNMLQAFEKSNPKIWKADIGEL